MPVLIGTSGWQYRHWRETFYPRGVAQKVWLEYYVERFDTVEINNAFYMLPKQETFASWSRRMPDGFVAAVKMNRYVTHIRRLRDSVEAVKRFLDNAQYLGDRLGPVLLQLPPNLKADNHALNATLRAFPKDVRVAAEFRHESWFTDETRALLERHRAALCFADRESRPIAPLWRTADWGYLRFHEGAATPRPCYGHSSLDTWARRLRERWSHDEDIYVYFNNDPRACALRDARWFARSAERAGLAPTRVPPARDVKLG